MNPFKAYDIRGVYPTDLDENFATRIGKAFGTFILGRIVIGRDTRLSGPSLKQHLMTGLLSTGVNVIDIGITTSPALMFAVKLLDCDGGVIVTASHNPKDFNGFKFYRKNGVPISYETGLRSIEELFDQQDFIEGSGSLEKKDVHQNYTSFLLNKIRFEKKPNLKIVVDAGNGSSGLVYPSVLRKVGVDVVELFCEPNGNYPNHEPDPSKPENLVKIQKEVKETRADLGFAFDGDGDRLAVIDERGDIIPAGVVFSILIENALIDNPQSKIIYTALDSQAIDEVIRQKGGVPVVCRVGHTYITQKLLEENAKLAGEISGHYYFRETHGADDALFASLKVVQSLTNFRKKLSDYLDSYPRYFSQTTEILRFPIDETEKFVFIEKLKQSFRMQGYEIDTIDGVKIILKDGWAMFRPSNTEAVISVSYEAKSQNAFARIEAFVQNIIETIPR